MMKAIFAMMLLGVAVASTSCRVDAPLDPVTMKPSRRCCPENYHAGYVTTCGKCEEVLIVGSK